MSENLNEQTHIDTTGLKDVSEGFSGLATANNQNIDNTLDKGFSGVVTANTDNNIPPEAPPPPSDTEEK
ncbi:MAG: hypothetical protein GQ570_14145 [Helicobacteraceae bacterium]|nr:hypothetical protein [Helicobacteraceae bacterium]